MSHAVHAIQIIVPTLSRTNGRHSLIRKFPPPPDHKVRRSVIPPLSLFGCTRKKKKGYLQQKTSTQVRQRSPEVGPENINFAGWSATGRPGSSQEHPVDDPLQRNDVRGLLRNEAKFRLNTGSAT